MDYVKYIRSKVGHDEINLTGVNVIIINKNNEVLLQKRGDYPYKWGLIGGVTELGEALEDTAVREAKEETNLSIKDLKLVGTVSGNGCFMTCSNGDKVHFITVGFSTKEYSGEIQADGTETKGLKFFKYEDVPDMPKTHKRMLDKYFANEK